MQRAPFITILLAGGLVLGLTATVALVLGFEPAPLSPWLVKVALYKLTYIAAAGLLVTGAVLGRWAKRSSIQRPSTDRRYPDEQYIANPTGRHGRGQYAELRGIQDIDITERQLRDKQGRREPHPAEQCERNIRRHGDGPAG